MRTFFTKKRTKKQYVGHGILPYCPFLCLPLLCWLLLCCQLSTAQSYPVQVLAQSTPPTPAHFSDFASTNTLNGPLRVQIVLNDLQISNRQVRLQVSFSGNGIGFKGRETVVGAAPLFLEGGLPIVLDHTLLAPYFEFANLAGISPNAYGAPIPDGAYQVCFEVFDVLTGKRLSNNACTILNVFKNSPPLLVLPQNGSDLVERSPQNIVFQWTPRHINVGQVEYELSLVEIWDNALDPQAAFLGSNPLFTATTSATTYVYGPSDPMLLPNRTYAWRVRAKAKQGAEDIGMFENQGHSQIFSFKHIEGCHVPHGIRHEIKGAHQANVLWDDPSTEVPRFTVRYRAKGDGNQWFLNRTTANWTTLWDLKAGTTYEYQLKKACTVAESDWSPIRQFTTHLQTEEEDLYQCGMSPSVDIANQDPLPDLGVGESFTAGDFQVVATEVSGGNGYFTGRGYTRLPYLNNIKLAVHFTNILVNTERQLAQGTVITEFDPTMGNIVDTGDVVETVGELGGAVGELFNAIAELLSNYKGTEEEVSLLQELNKKQDTYIAELISSPHITTETKNELVANQEVYNTVSNDLIVESTGDDGYDTGSGMANQVIQKNNELQASIEKAEDEVFVGDAYHILSTDGVYQEVLEKIKTISEYLKESAELCREQGWGSYKDQGVFPYCLWKEAPIAEAFYYSKVDIPFVAGLTDGLYGEVEGLVLLPKMFYDLSTGMQEFIYAYTWAKLQCTPNKVALNQKRMGLLLEKLEKEQAETSIWSWVKEQWYAGQKELTAYKDKRCRDAEKLRNEVDEFVDFIQERENLKQLIADVEEKLADYWGAVNDTNNEARYHHGKIFIVVASSLVPVAGWVSKSTKVKKILQAMRNFTKAQWDELFGEANRRFNVALTGSYWNNFSKIRMKIATIDKDGWLMGKYINGKLQVIGNTDVAQKWDYIVKTDGQILVGRKHSWLSQGEDVLAAGELKFNNGKLVEISNASGHYEPTISEASNFLRIFRQANVEVENATLTILDKNGNIFKQVTPTAGDRLTYY